MVWEVFVLCSTDGRFINDGVYHSMLVNTMVEALVSSDSDAEKLFVCGICHLVSVSVEYLDIVPFVKVLLVFESAEVITVCYDDHWFLCLGPSEEELEVPWGVRVSSLFKALVELY